MRTSKQIVNIRPLYIGFVLLIITVGLYYNSLIDVYFNPKVFSIDDDHVINKTLTNRKLEIDNIFGSGSTGKYYRPFLTLSYLLDQRMWGDIPFGYRLTNVLIHAFNAALLFFAARAILINDPYRNETAFFAAIIFAVHPISVESISWISGRTDPLATFWTLLAVILYISGRERRMHLVLLSILCAAAAVFSKEVGIVTPLLIAAWEVFHCKGFGFKKKRFAGPVTALFVSIIALYIILRASGLSLGDKGIAGLGNAFSNNYSYILRISLASIGFYLKKFIFPFPLNFTIVRIHTYFYAFIGLSAVLVFAAYFFKPKAKRYHFFFLWALLGIGPGAVISFTTIAWTPWAERYLYFSAAPLSIICGMVFSKIFYLNERLRNFYLSFVILIILCFAFTSYSRNLMWNDNERFWHNNFIKNPGYGGAANEYANALTKKGRTVESERILKEALSFPGPKHLLYLNLGYISRGKGNFEEAADYYAKALAEARADKKLVLEGASLRSKILSAGSDLELAKANLVDDLTKKIHYLNAADRLIEANGEKPSDKFLIYRAAKLYLAGGDKNKAAAFFKKFITGRRRDHYSDAAEKLLKRIEAE